MAFSTSSKLTGVRPLKPWRTRAMERAQFFSLSREAKSCITAWEITGTGNLHLQRIIHRPAHLAPVLGAGRNLVHAAVLAVGALHQVHEPGPDDGAVAVAAQYAVLVRLFGQDFSSLAVAVAEGAVEVEGGADQGQVGEGLGEVAQGLA